MGCIFQGTMVGRHNTIILLYVIYVLVRFNNHLMVINMTNNELSWGIPVIGNTAVIPYLPYIYQ